MQLAPFAETKGAKHQNMELFAIYLLPNRPRSITQQRFQKIYEGCQATVGIYPSARPDFAKGAKYCPLGFLVDFFAKMDLRNDE